MSCRKFIEIGVGRDDGEAEVLRVLPNCYIGALKQPLISRMARSREKVIKPSTQFPGKVFVEKQFHMATRRPNFAA